MKIQPVASPQFRFCGFVGFAHAVIPLARFSAKNGYVHFGDGSGHQDDRIG
jgi:hypothetical protein